MDKQSGSANTPEEPKKKKKSAWKSILLVLQIGTILFFMGVLFAGAAAAGYVASLVKDDPVRSYDEIHQKISTNNLTGFAYFADKTLIGQLITTEDRRLVSHTEVSPHLIDAIISTEDKYFYEHKGIVPSAIARAGIQQITGAPVQTGGSTLTQQLVKQTILSPEQTMQRKFREMFLALRVERMFTKDQILDAYINKMYFGKNANGSNVYGVQAAAKGIFGVDAKDLNIPQAAYLAGMLQAPSSYIPFKNIKKNGLKLGKERQKLVLSRMLENGKITKQEYDEAIAYDIEAHLAKPSRKAFEKYPYLMMEIEQRAAELLVEQDIAKNPDLKKESFNKLVEEKRIAVRQGGYHIYTTINKNVYEKMQQIAANPANFGPDRPAIDGKPMPEQVGGILINNKTGAILGMMEGRNFETEKTNHVTALRQPGSTIKPLAVYGPAIEEGIVSPSSTVVDEETVFPGGYTPKNANNTFKGPVTVRDALKWSRNVPAVKVYFKTGVRKSLSYVKKMGVTSLVDSDYYLPSALGGLTYGISVEEMTNAYATFANEGQFVDAYLIQRIENSDHEVVYEHKAKPVPVFSPQTALLVTDMLRDVISSGTGTRVLRSINGHDVAGKTGTTQDERDKWFVGYTKDISLGVWVGYDKKYKLYQSSFEDAQKIWGKIFSSVLGTNPQLSPVENVMGRPDGAADKGIYNADLAASHNPSSYGKKEEPKKQETKPDTANSQDKTNTDVKTPNGTDTAKDPEQQKTDGSNTTEKNSETRPKDPDKPVTSKPGHKNDSTAKPDDKKTEHKKEATKTEQ
ncbi:transglycosylase domain-containing protein [Aneurinibacillus uraniidurans]|uniref:transglycosylase domain-containing protein n=1 Tax=Aneurinibacillus uraniidurans TaxID=2966586 RepID=UPI00234B7A53|nr:transglycosylase domain-containing protein [Aneurinibacillus sp. B1]WCN37052.1 transglycosylase domain-containing protein [Aneurinibacillus sp. B1]